MKRMSLMLSTVAALAAGCRGEPTAAKARNGEAPAGEAAASHDEPGRTVEAAGAGEHGGHAPGEAEEKGSDLDESVAALLSRSCEHGKKSFECDDCRYAVGVARVPKAMLDDGVVKTAVAERRKMEAPIQLTGEIRFDERRVAHLAPSTEARVRAVRVTLGQRVRAGEALVELESVALGEAQSQYLEARGALELARRAAERAESLREEKIASEKEWLQARAEHVAAEIRARAAQEKLVRPDPSILTVGDLSELWLLADLYEDQLGRVVSRDHGALRAGVSVKAFPGEVFPGTVEFVGPTMDEKTRTVKVRVAVKNPDGKLRAGMFAAVDLYLPGDEEALAVPRSAVADEGRSFVFVHHHGEYFIRRPVEAGRATVDWVEVKKGLGGGEVVAAVGAFLLKSDVLRSKMGAGCAD
jgi:cobalt-zinc-cadmium efflux system membrane fusion protein